MFTNGDNPMKYLPILIILMLPFAARAQSQADTTVPYVDYFKQVEEYNKDAFQKNGDRYEREREEQHLRVRSITSDGFPTYYVSPYKRDHWDT